MKPKVGIQIHPHDNVVTLVEEASPGACVRYRTLEGDREIVLLDDVPFGHKAAVREIPAGEKVVKYDEAIGRASRAICEGEHVHAHNVESSVQGGAT